VKHVILWTFFALGIVAGALGALAWRFQTSGARESCYSNLNALSESMSMYAREHSGAFPSNVAPLSAYGSLGPGVFACRGSQRAPGDMSDVDKWTDYIYLSWSTATNANNYALAYDRRMSNHQGMGVNVVLVNGVEFWDHEGTWLKAFARRHPELKLDLPRDLK